MRNLVAGRIELAITALAEERDEVNELSGRLRERGATACAGVGDHACSPTAGNSYPVVVVVLSGASKHREDGAFRTPYVKFNLTSNRRE